MRSVVVAGAVLGLSLAFGLGVVVGRFVLNDDGTGPMASTPLPGLFGAGGGEAMGVEDPSLLDAPPAPPGPLAPAVAPGSALTPEEQAARAESEAAMAASGCQVRVSRRMPVRDFASTGEVVAETSGGACGDTLVRISIQGPDGATLYSMSAPAADFGVPASADPATLRSALDSALPASAVRGGAYPGWADGAAAPAGTEFDRNAYEAVRAADNPVVCIKMPTAPERCVAASPEGGPMRVMSRG